MKKLFCILLAFTFLFISACGGQVVKKEPTLLDKVDDSFVDKYITALDIALIGENELIFEKSEYLTSDTLFMFFCFALGLEDNDGSNWFNSATGKYTVNAKDIKAYAQKYIAGDITVPDYYEKETATLSGFGGNRNVKVTDKELLDEKTIRVTADFLDEDDKVDYTKVYTFEVTEDSVKYVSITKNYDKSENKPILIGLCEAVVGQIGKNGYTNYEYGEFGEGRGSLGEIMSTDFDCYNYEGKTGVFNFQNGFSWHQTFEFDRTWYSVRFTEADTNGAPIIVSQGYNPLPRSNTKITDFENEKYLKAVNTYLAEQGVTKTPPIITDIYECDADNDGQMETAICANSHREQDYDYVNWQGVSLYESEVRRYYQIEEGSGIYSIVLLLDGEKVNPVFSKIVTSSTVKEPREKDISFITQLFGFFDLNGDGEMEVVFRFTQWDWPQAFAVKTDSTSEKPVAYGSFGW